MGPAPVPAHNAPDPGLDFSIPAMARQAQGHPEVIVKDAPDPQGKIVARVPNGQSLIILDGFEGEHARVSWHDKVGWAKSENLVRQDARAPAPKAMAAAPAAPAAVAAAPAAPAAPAAAAPAAVAAASQGRAEFRNSLVAAFQPEKAVAQQVDGHPDVVLKDAPNPQGTIVAKVPNGQSVTVLVNNGEYVRVRRQAIEGWSRSNNLVRQPAQTQISEPGGVPACARPGCSNPPSGKSPF